MKKIFFLILFTHSLSIYAQLELQRGVCEGVVTVPIETFNICNPNPWVLIFEDNFEGTSLDLTKWTPIEGVPRDFNFNDQKAWHTAENIIVSNGTLKIVTEKLDTPYQGTWVIDWSTSPPTEKTDSFNYTTGEIWSKYEFEYGKIEARIKIPKGKGFWPAFWAYSGNPWNEIDIFEFSENKPREHDMNVHCDYYNQGDGHKKDCHSNYTGVDFSQDFHIFTLTWERNKIEWLVDGEVVRSDYRYYTILGQEIGCTIYEYQQYAMNIVYPINPMSIILNLAIESKDNAPNDSTPFPSQMEIDWVRYYQRKPCQNITITNADQQPLINDVYNAIVGENICINCDYIVQSEELLEIAASDEITLKSGFKAENGSTFMTRIDPTICGTSTIYYNHDNDENDIFVSDINFLANKKEIIDKDFQIYPNPSSGIVHVESTTNSLKRAIIKVYNSLGILMLQKEAIIDEKYQINLTSANNGLYLITIETDNSNLTKKIIINHEKTN
ncbi:MAG: family 16 glycosylhydrolase [Lentimicrobiaceae bacterium]|jgi:beta-glucanase (GH16 family)|nr:family 16 glycosylhydrolase [Lentimicrobiaceae bacterium]